MTTSPCTSASWTYSLTASGPNGELFLVTCDGCRRNIGYAKEIGGPLSERPDRGARALAQGIAIGISGEPNGLGLTWNEAVTVGHRIAGHLVGPGAFLPDAAELERLRRIEAAARRVNDAMQTVWATSQNFAEEPRSGDAKTFWLMARDEADAAHRALHAALEPEGSAQG